MIMAESLTNTTLDDLFSILPGGSLTRAISNNLYGINHRQMPGLVPHNRDTYGLTFFVRPQLNLLGDNIRNVRRMYSLLSKESLSMQRFVRCTLDPRLNNGFTIAGRVVKPVTCPIVDPEQAFIPVFTNNLSSCSGWPDIALPTYTSTPGLYKEVYTQADGQVTNYESWDLDCTFANKRGDMIAYTVYIWLHYMACVFEGTLVPYPDFLVENEIDYMSRVYRLTLDQSKRVVTKIGATGVCFPTSLPTGSFFDFQKDKTYNDQNAEISVRFRCLGFDTFDDILIYEFNTTVGIFNPNMREANHDIYMIMIPEEVLGFFNNRGYPRINPDNNVLEWWIDKDKWDIRTTQILNLKEYSNYG